MRNHFKYSPKSNRFLFLKKILSFSLPLFLTNWWAISRYLLTKCESISLFMKMSLQHLCNKGINFNSSWWFLFLLFSRPDGPFLKDINTGKHSLTHSLTQFHKTHEHFARKLNKYPMTMNGINEIDEWEKI